MKVILALFLLTFGIGLDAQSRTNPADQPVELGKVSWLRDYDTALQESRKTGKPILILFQEVPGCSTCQRYGNFALSHPLLVDGIENEFVPLAIFNNKGGADRQVLERYNEPTWNNPVVRIVNANGDDIIQRVAGDYTPKGLLLAMKVALLGYGAEYPGYLKALELELTSADTEDAYFQMYCFWSGEHHLGNHDGVFTTEPGFMNGHEVVKLTYDPEAVSPQELAKYAAKKDIKAVTKGTNYRIAAKDHYYQLQQTDLIYLPLTEVQKTKINSALHRGQNVLDWLSPSQKQYYQEVVKAKAASGKLYAMDFVEGWGKMLASK
ncbi:MAG: VPGUxxT family thioredoxin-like (seleno)protein, type 2 [Bacteroidota bacterium]